MRSSTRTGPAVSGRVCRTTCRRSPRRTTTSRCGATTAPTSAIHDLLRCQVREKVGRAEDPTAVVLDTQSVRAANHVPANTTGKDAAKRVPGRKRGLAVDVLGLIVAVVVMAASAVFVHTKGRGFSFQLVTQGADVGFQCLYGFVGAGSSGRSGSRPSVPP